MEPGGNDDSGKSSKKIKIKAKRKESRKFIYPALKNTKNGEVYGYIDEKGIWVIEPRFKRAYDFNELGIAIVTENDKDGIINLLGEYVVNPIYDNISQFKEDRAIFIKDEKMGVIDCYGKVKTKRSYGFIGDFNEGRAVVGESNINSYKYGYIDIEGNEVIQLIYDNAEDFKDGFAIVKIEDKKYELIDKGGIVINKYTYDSVSQYGNELMVFSKDNNGLYGYINKQGEEVIKPIFTIADKFVDGVAIVSTEENYDGPYGVINIRGEYIYTPIFSEIKQLGEERLALGMPIGKTLEDDKFITPSIYSIGDFRGNILTVFKYLNVGQYKNGIAYASNTLSTFFIDNRGKIVGNLPKVKGQGELYIKNNIVYADIDYQPYYLTRSGKIVYKPSENIQLSDTYSLVYEKYKPNFNLLIYIPEVRGVRSKRIQKKINIKLRELSYFKHNDKEEMNSAIDENDILDYSYYGNFEIRFFKKDLLVLSLIGYYYPLGAAHGLSTKITPNINLVTGEFYLLQDLFKEEVDWVKVINKIIQDKIDNDDKYKYVYKDGFSGIKKEQNFYVDKKNLYIYFQPYELGPYSAGFITFDIAFKQIDNIIDKKREFYQLLNK